MCRLHGQHLAEGVTIHTASPVLLSRLFSFSQLMRTYYMRAVISVSSIVREQCIVERGIVGTEETVQETYSEELAQYMFVHANRFRASQQKPESHHHWVGFMDGNESESDDEIRVSEGMRSERLPACRPGLRGARFKDQLLHDVVAFFRMWNGKPWEDVCQHRCNSCCSSTSDSKAKMEAAPKTKAPQFDSTAFCFENDYITEQTCFKV